MVLISLEDSKSEGSIALLQSFVDGADKLHPANSLKKPEFHLLDDTHITIPEAQQEPLCHQVEVEEGCREGKPTVDSF